MHIQQEHENVLFAAPSLPAQPSNLEGAPQPRPQRDPIKRLPPLFTKSSRSARLGAAAAAAAAASCDPHDIPSETESETENYTPSLGTGFDPAAHANRLLHSLLGSMPALPGSPTLNSPPDTGPNMPLQLLPRSPAMTYGKWGRDAAPAGTFSGGYTHTALHAGSPCLTKSQSARTVAGFALALYDDTAPAAVHVRRTLTRKSVDAAADAETLATRHISDLSAAPPSECGGPGDSMCAALESAAAAAAAAARAHPPTAAMTMAGSVPSSAAAAVPHWRGGSAAALGLGRSMGTRPSSLATSCPSDRLGSLTRRERSQSCGGGAAAAAAAVAAGGAAEGRGAEVDGSRTTAGALSRGDSQRRREVEGRQRPRWFWRLLRVLHVEKAADVGRGNTVDGGGASGGASGGGGSSCGSGGGSSSNGQSSIGGRNDGGDSVAKVGPEGQGKVGSDSNSEQPGDGAGGGVVDGGGRVSGGSGSSGGGGGGGGSGGKVDAGRVPPPPPPLLPPSIHADSKARGPSLRTPRDQFAAATRLLSSRLGRRSRSGEYPAPSVMTSRDSTTVHRARLAQQAKPLAAAAAPAFHHKPTAAQLPYDTGTNVPNDAVATISARKLSSSGSSSAAAAAAASGPAAAVSITAFAQAAAAAAATTAAAVATGRGAATAADDAGPVELPEVRFHVQPAASASAGRDPRVGPGLRARLARQMSAPGRRPEAQLTFLRQLEARSSDGGATDAAADRPTAWGRRPDATVGNVG